MILLQAIVVGLLGYGMGVGLAALLRREQQGGRAGVLHPLAAAADHRRAVVLICILSSLLSVRRVIVLEPAVVFRG